MAFLTKGSNNTGINWIIWNSKIKTKNLIVKLIQQTLMVIGH